MTVGKGLFFLYFPVSDLPLHILNILNMSKIRIAFVTPPLKGHEGRGSGVYTDNLFNALQHEKAISIKKVSF